MDSNKLKLLTLKLGGTWAAVVAYLAAFEPAQIKAIADVLHLSPGAVMFLSTVVGLAAMLAHPPKASGSSGGAGPAAVLLFGLLLPGTVEASPLVRRSAPALGDGTRTSTAIASKPASTTTATASSCRFAAAVQGFVAHLDGTIEALRRPALGLECHAGPVAIDAMVSGSIGNEDGRFVGFLGPALMAEIPGLPVPGLRFGIGVDVLRFGPGGGLEPPDRGFYVGTAFAADLHTIADLLLDRQ